MLQQQPPPCQRSHDLETASSWLKPNRRLPNINPKTDPPHSLFTRPISQTLSNSLCNLPSKKPPRNRRTFPITTFGNHLLRSSSPTMGKRKQTQKQLASNPTSPPRREEPENPPPPPLAVVQPGTMISTSALETFLRATNPNVDWSAMIAALSQVAGAVTAMSAISTATASQPPPVPPATVPETTVQTTVNPTPQKSIPSTETKTSKLSPKPTLTEPLDLSPISAYKSLGTEEESGEGEKTVGEEKAEEEGDIEGVKEITRAEERGILQLKKHR